MSASNNKKANAASGSNSGGGGLVRQSSAISSSGLSKSNHKSMPDANKQQQPVGQPTINAVPTDGVGVPPVPNISTPNVRVAGPTPGPQQRGSSGGVVSSGVEAQAPVPHYHGTSAIPVKQNTGAQQQSSIPVPTPPTTNRKQATMATGKIQSRGVDDVPIPDFDIAAPASVPAQNPQQHVNPQRSNVPPTAGVRGKVGRTTSKRVARPGVKKPVPAEESQQQQQFQNILQHIRGGGAEGFFTRIIVAFQIAGVYLSQGRILGLLGVIGDWIYNRRVPFLCIWAILFLLIGFFVNRYVSWGGGLVLVILGTILGNRRDDYDGFPFIFVGILIYLIPFFV